MRLAYADPPYPGKAHYYADHPDYGGEVDLDDLAGRLLAYDGWAVSTSESGLALLLPALTGAGHGDLHVAAWERGARARDNAAKPLNAWEPVVYWGGRRVPAAGGTVDVLCYGQGNRLGDPGRVTGTKPAAFCQWVFDLLGARPGDRFFDLYPGSGGVRRAWNLFNRPADVSR